MGTVYVSEGTYMAYIYVDEAEGDPSPLLAYRETDDSASCPGFASDPAYASDCMRMYSVAADGSTDAQQSQMQYDARREEWFSAATERGSDSWSGPHYSNLTAQRLITFSMPGYSPNDATYHSVSHASLRLSYSEFPICFVN